MNTLKNEKSLYLKQHQDNPIHWKSYNQETRDLIKNSNMPAFISIGYSSCHWCHVMADESFSDQNVADFLNENFVCIKIDKEEFPDVDQYYQMAATVYNGRGGWPLSVFTTSDLEPYFVGTYFPKVDQKETPSFLTLAKQMQKAFKEDTQAVLDNSAKAKEFLRQSPKIEKKIEFKGHFPHPMSVMQAIEKFEDSDFGGYGAAPKFPQFAFYEYAVEQMLEGILEEKTAKHIIESLERMLMGGIYDHAKGGIHRYSTDEKWLIPHFEKMLYDQAGFLRTISKVSLLYPSPLLLDSLIQTMDYLGSEMISDDGYFFTAQDADSEGVEGLYFSFTQDEFIDAILKFDESLMDRSEDILKWFNVTEEGNFTNGMNVISLNIEQKVEFYKPENWEVIRKVKSALLEDRKKRIPPTTDSKGLASYNYMLLSSLCDVVQYTKIESISQMAIDLIKKVTVGINNSFMKARPDLGDDKSRLLHSTTLEQDVPLFEDYVFFLESQLRLYEITSDTVFYENAKKSIDFIFNHFGHEEFFVTRSLKEGNQEPQFVTIFDQSYRAPVATMTLICRKWYFLLSEKQKSYMTMISEKLTQLSLQNPLTFGESIRALVYPDQAFKRIEVPAKWAQNQDFLNFMIYFSVRFTLTYHQDDNEKWQICTMKECEFDGVGLEPFLKIFDRKGEK